MRKIALDCDDVLFRSRDKVFEYLRTHAGTFGIQDKVANLDTCGSTMPEILEALQPGRLQMARMVLRATIRDRSFFAGIEPFPDAKEVLERLAGRFSLTALTTRPKSVVSLTQKKLDQYYPGCFQGIQYTGGLSCTGKVRNRTKGSFCSSIGASVLVDDQLDHCTSASDLGIEGIWFRGYEHPGIIRHMDTHLWYVSSWDSLEVLLGILYPEGIAYRY